MRIRSMSLAIVILAYVAVFTAVLPSAFSDAAAKVAIAAKDSKALKTLDEKYQKAKAVAMKVDKNLKLGLLGEERKSNGTLWISDGQIRMELEGTEKSLLVVNKKHLWAVNYPDASFPDAPIQVIKGDATNKKGQAKNIMSLLTVGGFLKFFNPTEFKTAANGERVYTLAPKKGEQTDFKKAQVTLTKDASSIAELKYWDNRDNETTFRFREVKFDGKESFGKKIDAKLFEFEPPKGADVTNL